MLLLRQLSKDELLELIQSCSPDFDSSEKTNISFLQKTHNSSLYLASNPSFPHPLLIKHVKTNDAAKQYESLVLTAKKMEGSIYRVSRPVAYIPKRNVVIMEYIHSACLATTLLQKNIRRSDKNKYIEASAKWIASFHTAYQPEHKTIDFEKKISDLLRTLSNVKSVPSRHFDIIPALCWLQSSASNLQARKIAFGHTHGDFKQENILYSEGTVYGIDIMIDEKEVQIMDLVQFTNHLLFLTMTPKGKPYHQYISEWTSLFLNSYAKGQVKVDTEIFTWLRLQHLMRYWSFEAARKNPLSFIYKHILTNEISTIYHSIKPII